MKAILKSIQNRIAEITSIAYVDEDWGQLDNYSPNPPTKFPFALIDFTDGTFSNIGAYGEALPKNRQMSTELVTITVGNLKLSNTSFKAPLNQKNDAMAIWDIIDEVHDKLHGWHPTEECGALIRARRQRVIRDDGIQEYRITYTMGLTNV